MKRIQCWTIGAVILTSTSVLTTPCGASDQTPVTLTKGTEVSPPILELSSPQVVRISFPQAPSTRTSCTFDATDGSETVTLEWDPMSSRSLLREVTLPKANYRIACSAEPARHALDARANFAWTFLPKDSDKGLAFCDPGVPATDEPCKDKTYATISANPPRSLGDAEMKSLEVSAALPVLGAAPRAFGSLSDTAVNEAFQVVAEVVVEQAKSKGLKLVTLRLQDLLCSRLVDKEGTKPLFPRTCDTIRMVRIEDLASTGRPLLSALVEDLSRKAMDSAKVEAFADSDRLVRLALDTMLDVTAGRQDRLRGAGQRLLLSTLRANAGITTHPEVLLAYAIIQECAASRCDTSRIERMLDKPNNYFTVPGGDTATNELKKRVKDWPNMATLITSALSIIKPSSEVTETMQIKASVEFLFGIIARIQGIQPENFTTVVDGASIRTLEKSDKSLLLQELIIAGVEQDLSRLTVPAVRLIESSDAFFRTDAYHDHLTRLARLGAALGAYISTSPTGRTPTKEEIAERNRARKDAVRTLIESQTERRSRLGDAIFSLGSTVGIMPAGFQMVSDNAQFRMQPVVTLGFAFDKHCAPSGWGFHLELMPINLGSYASLVHQSAPAPAQNNTTTETPSALAPSAIDALSPSLTLGASYVVKSVDLVLHFGPTVGYSIKGDNVLGSGDPQSYRGIYFGLTAGAYIPIFDIN